MPSIKFFKLNLIFLNIFQFSFTHGLYINSTSYNNGSNSSNNGSDLTEIKNLNLKNDLGIIKFSLVVLLTKKLILTLLSWL